MSHITRNNILAKSNLLHLLSRSLIFLLNLHKDIVNLIVDQKTTLLLQTWKIDREAKKRWNQRSIKYTVLLQCIKWQFANDAGKETIWKTCIIDLSIYFHEREGWIVLRKKRGNSETFYNDVLSSNFQTTQMGTTSMAVNLRQRSWLNTNGTVIPRYYVYAPANQWDARTNWPRAKCRPIGRINFID